MQGITFSLAEQFMMKMLLSEQKIKTNGNMHDLKQNLLFMLEVGLWDEGSLPHNMLQ